MYPQRLNKDELKQDLLAMQNFCANKIDCLRQQLLAYLGEEFNAKDCRELCTNCEKK